MTEAEQLEYDIMQKSAKLAELRSKEQPAEVPDYDFRTEGGTVSLSDMFGDRDRLLVIHNMGQGCRYCTLWGGRDQRHYRSSGRRHVGLAGVEGCAGCATADGDEQGLADAYCKSWRWRLPDRPVRYGRSRQHARCSGLSTRWRAHPEDWPTFRAGRSLLAHVAFPVTRRCRPGRLDAPVPLLEASRPDGRWRR